jgi:hypothetical protein
MSSRHGVLLSEKKKYNGGKRPWLLTYKPDNITLFRLPHTATDLNLYLHCLQNGDDEERFKSEREYKSSK